MCSLAAQVHTHCPEKMESCESFFIRLCYYGIKFMRDMEWVVIYNVDHRLKHVICYSRQTGVQDIYVSLKAITK